LGMDFGLIGGGIDAAAAGTTAETVTGTVTRIARGEIGDLGEELGASELGARGFGNIRSIQNASGHGIDLVAEHRRFPGQIFSFEVKTSTTSVAPRLSFAQRNSLEFVTSRLERAATRARFWRNIPEEMRLDAEQLLEGIDSGELILNRGLIEIT